MTALVWITCGRKDFAKFGREPIFLRPGVLPAAPGNRWKATLQRSGYQCIGAQPYAEMLGFEALLDIPGLYSGQKAVLVRFLEHFEILPQKNRITVASP